MGRVFVTVGTTSFDELIKVVDTPEFRAAIASKGYSSLLIQRGRGDYIPTQSSDGIEGSGSIFEALRLGKPLVVVVNEALMDNHQAELAEELAASNYLFYASPATLVKTIVNMDLASLVPYEPSNPEAFVRSLNQFLGINDE